MSSNDQIYLGAAFTNSDTNPSGLHPGDLVQLDLTNDASVHRTTIANSTNVFGIIVVGGAQNSKVIVASFRGQRLRVNVSPADTINVGDLLVSSATAGLAQVNNSPPDGATFAIAIASKTGGSGTSVECLFSAVGVGVVTTVGSTPTTRVLNAGAGLIGGGDLTADRTFNVAANADGSIVVNANDIQIGVITDAQHGNRGGGALHAVATTSAAGFMSAADKTQLDANNASFVVANLAALAAINTTTFPAQGVRRFVTTVHEWYQLDKASSRTADGIVVVAATTGGGFWTRENRGDPIWGTFQFVSIDPVNGSDEAFGFATSQGAADAVALKTFAELNRRIPEGGFTEDITCHVLDSVPDDQEDQMILTRLKVQSYDTKFIIVGSLTSTARPSVFSGTVGGYVTSTAATNTQRQLTLTGATGIVGKLIQKADGSKSAMVLKDLGSSHFRISQPISNNSTTGALGSPVEFVNGESVVVYDLITMPIYPFPSSVFTRDLTNSASNLILSNTKLRRIDSDPVEIENGGSSSRLVNCIAVDPVLFGSINSTWSNVLFTSNVIGLGFFSGVASLSLSCCSLLNTQILLHDVSIDFLNSLDIEGHSSATSFAHFHMQRGNCQLTTTGAAVGIYNSTQPLINADVPSGSFVGSVSSLYGSGNSGSFYGLASGCKWSVRKSLQFATTSAAHTITTSQGGVYDYIDLPLSLVATQILFDDL